MAENAKELLVALAAADNLVATKTGELKAAKEAYARVEDRMFAFLDAQGTESIRNSEVGLQVSISETKTDTIDNWDLFARFVLRHKLLPFFQRRLSPIAMREWLEQHPGKTIPGVGAFTKRRLSVTKFSK